MLIARDNGWSLFAFDGNGNDFGVEPTAVLRGGARCCDASAN